MLISLILLNQLVQLVSKNNGDEKVISYLIQIIYCLNLIYLTFVDLKYGCDLSFVIKATKNFSTIIFAGRHHPRQEYLSRHKS